MSNVVISAYVSTEVAAKIEAIARAEDRSKSQVAGRILERQVATAPAPSAQFARRRSSKEGRK